MQIFKEKQKRAEGRRKSFTILLFFVNMIVMSYAKYTIFFQGGKKMQRNSKNFFAMFVKKERGEGEGRRRR